jgi:hypothetical protein
MVVRARLLQKTQAAVAREPRASLVQPDSSETVR